MKVVKQNIKILMSTEEVKCLGMASQILHKIQDSFPNETELEAVDSGEIVLIEEIAKVREVLGVFYENEEFIER